MSGPRWDALFADLSGELAAAESADLAAEVRERVSVERARLRLADRLRSAEGAAADLLLTGGEHVAGTLVRVAADWLLLTAPAGDVIVPLAAVRQVAAVPSQVTVPGPVAAGLTFAAALRRLARERRPVWLGCRDGTRLHGTLDHVGHDHLDLAEHPAGEPRRERAVTARWTVPLEAVAVVRASG